MTRASRQGPFSLRAIRVCELPQDLAHIDLYLEHDGRFLPYTGAKEEWTPRQKIELLQKNEFVLFVEAEREKEIRRVIDSEEILPPTNEEGFSLIIADGLSEFMKTRYNQPITATESRIFKGIATALQHYLTGEPRLRQLIERMALHDPYTFYHGMRTAAYTIALAPGKNLWDLALGAIFHDAGNLYLPAELLNRPGPLQDDEWLKVRRHPEDGHDLLKGLGLSRIAMDLVLHHHERADGEGYPHRLKTKDLSPLVRLLSFAEVFTALTHPRGYQVAHSPEEALGLMRHGLSSYLDPSLFAGLARLIGQDPSQPVPQVS